MSTTVHCTVADLWSTAVVFTSSGLTGGLGPVYCLCVCACVYMCTCV